MSPRIARLALALALPVACVTGCSRAPSSASTGQPHKHEHHPPHGGTPVVLGDEAYHVELVLDASTGTLQAFVLDGELENFIRSPVPSIEIVADVGGAPRTLVLAAVPNPATGETVGDTSLFQAQAEWLKTTRGFDAVLKSITVRGTTFAGVKFNFPKGNDTD
ncbi:MAG TPA: hypothetical protein VN775_05575 [Opitutaceae bacterium]|nr:hypothetical protein [Opitutaceae bacterium]